MAWWDEVSYDDLKESVATITDVPHEVAVALAQLRGQVATALLQALERGDGQAQQRAEKLFTFFDRTVLFKPWKNRGGRKAGNSGGLASRFARRIRNSAVWQSLAAHSTLKLQGLFQGCFSA